MDIIVNFIVMILKCSGIACIAIIALFLILFCIHMISKAVSSGFFAAKKRYDKQCQKGVTDE